MTPAAKLAGFGVVLAVALGGGAVAGNAVGPIDDDGPDAEPAGHGHDPSPGGADAAEADAAKEPKLPGGVLVAAEGYRLEADETILAGGAARPFTFRITGPDEAAVDELHLVVVGSDLGRYAHLHPERVDDRTWTTELPALAPGTYRAFADFSVPGGPELTLGLDLAVPGNAVFAPLPTVSPTAAVDGYEVMLHGTPEAGRSVDVGLMVTKDGQQVTDLQPYLGSPGHLVAIRSGDLAYLHVHPVESEGEAEEGVRFAIDVPTEGDYRLFFDFRHGDQVHTAAFTVRIEAP